MLILILQKDCLEDNDCNAPKKGSFIGSGFVIQMFYE